MGRKKLYDGVMCSSCGEREAVANGLCKKCYERKKSRKKNGVSFDAPLFPNRNKYKTERSNEALKLLNDGMPIRYVCEQTGLSRQWVSFLYNREVKEKVEV